MDFDNFLTDQIWIVPESMLKKTISEPLSKEKNMLKVAAQINNGDPCPKQEARAWDWINSEQPNLSDAITWLLDVGASGFVIENEDGKIIAESIVQHY